MTTPLNGEPVSLVTGASKGIGLETVRRLTGAGHRVYLAARDAERGRAAAEGLGARFVQLDVTSDDSVRHAAEIVGQEEWAGGRTATSSTPHDVHGDTAASAGPCRESHSDRRDRADHE